MTTEAAIISEVVKVHANNARINEMIRDARRMQADPNATSLTVSSGVITVDQKSGEGGGLFAVTIPTTLYVIHTINGLTEGDIVGIKSDGFNPFFVGNNGSGNCDFAPIHVAGDGVPIFLRYDEDAVLRKLDSSLITATEKYSPTAYTVFQPYSGQRIVFDLSSLTSNPVVMLKAPRGDGSYDEYLEVSVEKGHASNYLLVWIDTGVTVNGLSGTREWFRMQGEGERFVLKSNDDGTGWVLAESTPTMEITEIDATVLTTQTLSIDAYEAFDYTLTGNVTLTFQISSASGLRGFSLIVKQDATGSRVITWPSSVKWSGGVAPIQSSGANDIDVYTFITKDDGTTWYGFQAGKNMS